MPGWGGALTRRTVALVVGTRPEAIKMAPVYRALRASDGLEPLLISTGQHRELLETALEPLQLVPDHRLDVMQASQSLNSVIVRVIERLSRLLAETQPEALLVQGDTTSALASALAAYSMRVPVGHVEAGLRTYDHENPFPEEANRQLVDRISTWCFTPTQSGRSNLLAERIDDQRIHVTGNTVVDSLLWAIDRSEYRCDQDTVLLTLHRRESFGRPLAEILHALCDFLDAIPEARVLWPVHPNPNVREALHIVKGRDHQLEVRSPMNYLDFAGALASCRFILTDSGGLQEEAPSLGKIALVARDHTERPEALATGRNRMVGRERETVREALVSAWNEAPYGGPIPADNPYGDGHAGERIARILAQSLAGRSVASA